jgi:zinc protease
MNLTEDLARYKKVTKDDVMRVYRQYVKGKYAAIVNVFAKEKDATSAKEETKLATSSGKASSELEYKGLSYKRPTHNFDRSKRPEIKGTVTPVVPTVYKSSFDNGMKIIGTQNNELPLVTLIMNLRGGNIVMNDPNKSGLASLTAAMMEESTENYTAKIQNYLILLKVKVINNVECDKGVTSHATPYYTQSALSQKSIIL